MRRAAERKILPDGTPVFKATCLPEGPLSRPVS